MVDRTETFEERLRRYGLLPTPTNNVIPFNPPPAAAADGQPYANAAFDREITAVMTATEGTRNDTLNTAAFNLAGLVDAGALDRDNVIDSLSAAGSHAGLTGPEIRATITSAFRGSATKVGARHIPEQPSQVTEVNSTDFNHTTNRGDTGGDGGDTEHSGITAEQLHANKVAARAYELQINDEARILWAARQAAQIDEHRPEIVTLTDMLALPDVDATYRVTDLWPTGGRVLLAAQYKAGKTSLVANLLHTLADGGEFLGRYDVDRVERMALLDTELDDRMLRRWLRDQAIADTDRILVASLRGRLSTFNILDDTTRGIWAGLLRGCDVIVLDCLRPCLDAIGLSEDKEAGRFLVAFDELCKQAGASEAVVVHHMGHNSERSRGDSRLLDWPDVLWKIVRDTGDDGETSETGDRYFSAIGRDVNVAEQQLDWQPETRTLMVCGGGRNERRARGAVEDIVEILRTPEFAEGLSQTVLVSKLKGFGHGRNTARAAINTALDDGVLIAAHGPRGSAIHVLNPARRGG